MDTDQASSLNQQIGPFADEFLERAERSEEDALRIEEAIRQATPKRRTPKLKKTKRRKKPPPLTIEQILAWADAHHARTGQWPKMASGWVLDAPSEKWQRIDKALRRGHRGLPGGSSLARLLTEHLGVPHQRDALRFSEAQILQWADAHYQRTGEWPNRKSGPVVEAPTETWADVDAALDMGYRSLPGGSSLPRLLAEHRGVRNLSALPPLTLEQILAWADAYHERTGQWPDQKSGAIPEAPGEKWNNVAAALHRGLRGLPSGLTLARLLAQHRGVPHLRDAPRLTAEQILAWADAYHERTGQWPKKDSGRIQEAPSEKWKSIDNMLLKGLRGLPRGSSLARLLAERRGVRNSGALPPLTLEQILAWADAHYQRTGKWPKQTSGRVLDAPAEAWRNIHNALVTGHRGLPGGSSLARLLTEQRSVPHQRDALRLTEEQILAWADAYHARTGKWPAQKSGAIPEAPGEKWNNVAAALYQGLRGLPGGTSLARLLAERRGARNHMALPPLTMEQILQWADAHHARTGKWPKEGSGPIDEAPGETWNGVSLALLNGKRGLPGGSSLAKLLARYRSDPAREAQQQITRAPSGPK